MALASTTAENTAIGAIFPNGTTFYVALHTASPGTSGTGEQVGETRGAVAFGPASNGQVANTNAVTVTTTGAVASTYLSIYDAATNGNYKMGAPLSSSVTATTVTFAVGAISFSAS